MVLEGMTEKGSPNLVGRKREKKKKRGKRRPSPETPVVAEAKKHPERKGTYHSLK